MQGYRVHEWGRDPIWEQIPDPEPGAGEVLIEVEACGVGLTVLNCINGDLGDEPELLPLVPGHELVGRVGAAGPGADPDLVGRRVAAYFYLSCGECEPCRTGRESRCDRLAGHVGVHRDGGYAPRAVLPQLNAVPIPDSLDPVTATVVPDAVATPVHICRTRARVEPGDRMVVIGAGGGIGIHLVQVAQVCGARVVGIEKTVEKLGALEEIGVRAIAAEEAFAADPSTLFDAGPPTVIADLVGSAATLDWSLRSLGPGGRFVVLTTFRGTTATLDPRRLVFTESSVVGSRYCSPAEIAAAAELVAAGDVKPIIGAVSGPDRVLDLHEDLRAGRLLGRGALDWQSTG